MQSVVARLRSGLQMETRGGRVLHPSLHDAVVMDVSALTDAVWTDLKAAHPALAIDIVAEPLSLSGFAIRLRLRERVHSRLLLTAGLLAAMGAVVAHCLAECGWALPWPSGPP
jgi:hypothetical protein